jgi:hypothetical protein
MEQRVKSSRPSFQRGDIKAIILAVVLGIVFLYAAHTKYPDLWHYTNANFGPEWDCTYKAVFCVKRVPAKSVNQTAPSN